MSDPILVHDMGSASANGSELANAINTAPDGSTLLVAHSAFPYDLGAFTFPAKTLIIQGAPGGETVVADPLGDGSPWGCFVHYATTIAGYFKVGAGVNLTFQHLGVTALGWPAPLQSWREFLDATYPGANVGNSIFTGLSNTVLHFIDCEIWKGYGSTGLPIAPSGINPATGDGYDDLKTPNPYWYTLDNSGRTTGSDPGGGAEQQVGYGNWVGENYDALSRLPTFTGGRMGSVTLQNSWVRDLGMGLGSFLQENGTVTIDGSCVERTANDLVQTSTAPEATGPFAEIRFSNSIFRDQFGVVFDDTKLHGDDNQNYSEIVNGVLVPGSGYTDTPSGSPYTGVLLNATLPDGGGVVAATGTFTVQSGKVATFALTNDDAGGLPVGTVLTAAAGIGGGGGSGFAFTTGPLTRFSGLEVNNCLFMQSPGARAQPQGIFWQGGGDHNAAMNTVYDYPKFRNILILNANKGLALSTARDVYLRNSTFVNAPWFAPIGGVLGASVGATYKEGNAWAENTRGLMSSVIYEGAAEVPPPSIDWKRVSAFISPGSNTAAFVHPGGPMDQPASPSEAYLNFRTIGSYAAAGPQYATLRDMLNDTSGFAGEPPHLSFLDIGNLERGKLTLSELSYIHGGNVGDLLPISVAVGVEWIVIDLDRSTPLTDWTMASGTVPVGKYLKIRATSPAEFADSSVFSVTLGGVVFPWTLSTRSNLAFPRVTKPASNTIVRTTPGKLAAADSPKGMIFMEIMLASGQGALSNHSLFNGSGNRAVSCVANSAGGAVWTLSMQFSDGNGTHIAIGNYVDLAFDTWYRVQFIVDITQPTTDLQVIGQAEDPETGDITLVSSKNATPGKEIGFTYGQPNPIQFMSTLGGGFGMLAVNCGEAFSVVTTNFSPENAGYQGQGLSPMGKQLELFLPGEVTLDNRGVTSIPGGGEWGVDTGTLTAANTAIWPPPLTLLAKTESEGPYLIGLPIDIEVQTIGRNEPMTLTAASDGAGTFATNPQSVGEGVSGTTFTYTPTAEGSHTITFTNDVGYVDPAPLVLEVIAHATISAGQTAVLTKAQALALEAVTNGVPVANGVGPAQLRWNDGEGETGAVTGVDIRFNIIP